jgi:uncharacterized repeat protein (TIGR01451 family)
VRRVVVAIFALFSVVISAAAATPLTITKSFGVASIGRLDFTRLTFTIQNPDAAGQTGIAFTDTLPAGLIVASLPNLQNTCGGTASAAASGSIVSLTGGTLAAGGTCTVSANVQGTADGVLNNSVTISSTEGGSGNTSNASLTVLENPAIFPTLNPGIVPVGGTATLTMTLRNNDATTTLTGLGFRDPLPGTAVATPSVVTNSCGGTVTAPAGATEVRLTGGTVAPSATCTVTVAITGVTPGTYVNTVFDAGSNETGLNSGGSNVSFSVQAPPSGAIAFNPGSIPVGGTTTLNFTLTNPTGNIDLLSGVGFTMTLPAGLTVADAAISVCGGTVAVNSPSSISASFLSIPIDGQCVFNVPVTGAVGGNYTTATGPISSSFAGSGASASASLRVADPPTIAKTFGAATILIGQSTSLSFAINNAGATPLTGISFTDALPAGLVISTPNGLTTTCTGATITAGAGSNSISVTGGTLAAASNCTIGVNVTGVAAGVQNNTTGPISSTESGAGSASNTATITVIAPPAVTKAFGATNIPLHATTTLSFTITNPNATVALDGVGLVDSLPTGLVVSIPSVITGNCGAGVIAAAGKSMSLTGGTIPAGGSCTFSINIDGSAGGNQLNITGNVTSTNAGTGNFATASIFVDAPDLAVTKSHTGNFAQGQTGATYSIGVTNVGTAATSGVVDVTDTLPAGLTATAMSGTGWTCTLATLICSRSDALAPAASYPPIVLTVDVANTAPASVTNSVHVFALGDPNAANDTATDPTSIIQNSDLAIAKIHAGNFIQGQTGDTFRLTVSNVSATTVAGPVTVVDALPAGLTATAISGTGWNCTLATLTCTRLDGLAAGADYPAITLIVDVSSTAPASLTNTATLTAAADSNPANNTASDTVTIMPIPPDLAIVKTHAGNFTQGQTGATFTISISNIGASPTSGLVDVTDLLPPSLTPTAISGTGWTCTLAPLVCTRTDALAPAASFPPITIKVNVAADAPATMINIATVAGGGDVSLTNDGANDTVTVIPLTADLGITKTHAGSFSQKQTGAKFTLTVSNSGAAATAGTVTVVDILPAGLTATAITGSGWTCTLATLTCTRGDALAAGASYAPITVTADVAADAAATVTNTANVSGGGDTNAANNSASDVVSISAVEAIPTLSPTLLLVLAAILTGVAWRIIRR